MRHLESDFETMRKFEHLRLLIKTRRDFEVSERIKYAPFQEYSKRAGKTRPARGSERHLTAAAATTDRVCPSCRRLLSRSQRPPPPPIAAVTVTAARARTSARASQKSRVSFTRSSRNGAGLRLWLDGLATLRYRDSYRGTMRTSL